MLLQPQQQRIPIHQHTPPQPTTSHRRGGWILPGHPCWLPRLPTLLQLHERVPLQPHRSSNAPLSGPAPQLWGLLSLLHPPRPSPHHCRRIHNPGFLPAYTTHQSLPHQPPQSHGCTAFLPSPNPTTLGPSAHLPIPANHNSLHNPTPSKPPNSHPPNPTCLRRNCPTNLPRFHRPQRRTQQDP